MKKSYNPILYPSSWCGILWILAAALCVYFMFIIRDQPGPFVLHIFGWVMTVLFVIYCFYKSYKCFKSAIKQSHTDRINDPIIYRSED